MAVAYDSLQIGQIEPRLFGRQEARQYLQQRSGSDFDPLVVAQLLAMHPQDGEDLSNSPSQATRSLHSRELEPGMALAKDLITPSGMLLLTAGHVLEQPVIRQIINFERSIETRLSIQVLVPLPKP